MNRLRLIFASGIALALSFLLEPEPPRAQTETVPQVLLGTDESAIVRDLAILQRQGLTPNLRTTGAEIFDRALAQLAAKLDQGVAARVDDTEGQDIEAKLIAIALDRTAHPDRYEELRRSYLDIAPDSRRIAPGSPNLKGEHLTEDYRLAWEYFLLRPPAANYPDRFEARVIAALAAIANPASLPALDATIDATAHPEAELGTTLVMRQRGLLSALTAFPTPQGAESLGRAVAVVEDAQGRVAEQTVSSAVRQMIIFDPGAYGLRTIEAQALRRSQWRDAITEALSKPTPRRQVASEFLERASEALRQ